MAEILNKYKRWKARLILNREKELDFVLSQDNSPTVELNGELTEKCLISYIDMNIDGCVNEDGSVSSVSGYTYEKYVNNNVKLPDFGFTAVDNGRVEYDKDSISLDDVWYSFSFKVDDNIKEFEQKDENYLDIIEILCNNIVLEVPLRYTLVSDEELKGYAGEGWKLVSEEELELKNNPFSALQNIEDGSDK